MVWIQGGLGLQIEERRGKRTLLQARLIKET